MFIRMTPPRWDFERAKLLQYGQHRLRRVLANVSEQIGDGHVTDATYRFAKSKNQKAEKVNEEYRAFEL